MPLYQVAVLAVTQGVTEFLPISSTAHLILIPWLFGWRDPGLAFDVALHVGTLLAVGIYFARTWVRLAALAAGRRVWQPPPGGADQDLYQNARLLWFLALATAPAAAAGLALERQVETTLRSPLLIAVMMIVVGLVLWWAEKRGSFRKDLGQMSLADSMTIGAAQGLAIVPGTSRSGITMAAALFRGVSRSAAARFSFLLSTPVIAGACLKSAWNVLGGEGIPAEMQLPFAAGILISALSGYLVIAFFVRYLETRTFRVFVWYRVICGIMILALDLFFRDPAALP